MQSVSNGHKVSSNGIAVDWKRHGRAAGPIRSTQVLGDNPEMVVAFPGGKETAEMVTKAKEADLLIFEVERDGHS